jgi:hypothetical protein
MKFREPDLGGLSLEELKIRNGREAASDNARKSQLPTAPRQREVAVPAAAMAERR